MAVFRIKPSTDNYGLSEGVFKACLFLGLNFPPTAPDATKHIPSDYFSDNFDLNSEAKEKLQTERKLTDEKFEMIYKNFAEIYFSQRPFKHTKTDLNVYFCDYLLFSKNQLGASASDYFDFEFYKKPAVVQREFMTQRYRNRVLKTTCNVFSELLLIDNKVKTNKIFNEFLHRDWLYTGDCAFEEFRIFVGNHPQFFSKPFNGSLGRGAQIISVNSNANLEKLFSYLKNKQSLLEEVVIQHKSLQDFCPDVVNTIRVNTFLDVHNVAHIVTAEGKFGRLGNVADNFYLGGYCVVIDPETGIVISDAINKAHERISKHPDTGKIFKGFQYPCWENLRETVKKMVKLIPQVPYVGWDLAINDKGETVLIEANNNPDINIQQAPDDVGRMYLYRPFIEELDHYKKEQLQNLGYRVNNIHNFNSSYDPQSSRHNLRLQYAMDKLIPDCTSLIDLGCRKAKFIKSVCPKTVKYYPVDFKKHDDEVIACDFNNGEFPNIKADTCFCALTAEYVEALPQFLSDMCNAAQKQILMLCRPFDREISNYYRWRHAFLTDFTEKFLLENMQLHNFRLVAQYLVRDNRSVILYDFRKILPSIKINLKTSLK